MRILAAAVLIALGPSVSLAAYYSAKVEPREGDKFKSADYSLYIPDHAKTIRAIIVHQHGCGRDGITNDHDLQWQALADKWDAALMGTHLVPENACPDWHDPANGSGDAFLNAIHQFAQQSHHGELDDAPWCLWGHSGGAHWVFAMTAKYPDRVVACMPRSGGEGVAKLPLNVPVCFQLGAKERTDRFAKLFETAVNVYESGRKNGAIWCLAIDPKSSHDTRNSRELAIPFFDACLEMRLPPATTGMVKLKPITQADGSLASLKTLAMAPLRLYQNDLDAASWVPNFEFGQKWREFIETGEVKDTTPPPAPSGAKMTLEAGKAMLTWNCAADLESGIRCFNVYRDGKLIGRVDGSDEKHPNRPFQSPNYGDEPEPVSPAMRFTDPAPEQSAHYEVSQVNTANLESSRVRFSGPIQTVR